MSNLENRILRNPYIAEKQDQDWASAADFLDKVRTMKESPEREIYFREAREKLQPINALQRRGFVTENQAYDIYTYIHATILEELDGIRETIDRNEATPR